MNAVKKSVQSHMVQLCEKIGARPTGSEANKAAAVYAEDVFKRLGLGVMQQEFSCMDWQNKGAALSVDQEAVEAEAAEYSLPCEVEGPLVCVNTIEELKGASLEGAICVMSGSLCKEALMPKSFTFWNPEEHQEIIRQLEEKKPLAVITVSYVDDIAVPVIQDGDFIIPCAVIKGNCADKLLAGKNATLRLFTERKPSTGANVIAVYGEGKQRVSFSAHIDTAPSTPGALDNASGVAALMALAEKVTQSKYPYQIEFVLFNGEDYYATPGETAYTNRYLQNPNEIVCAFNVDGIGMLNSKTSYSFYECPEMLEQRINGLAEKLPDIEKIDPWPMGEHMLYASAGIPALAITASDIFRLMGSVLHTPSDCLSAVDLDRIVQTVSFLYDCIKDDK